MGAFQFSFVKSVLQAIDRYIHAGDKRHYIK
jgi:hypothetical protein